VRAAVRDHRTWQAGQTTQDVSAVRPAPDHEKRVPVCPVAAELQTSGKCRPACREGVLIAPRWSRLQTSRRAGYGRKHPRSGRNSQSFPRSRPSADEQGATTCCHGWTGPGGGDCRQWSVSRWPLPWRWPALRWRVRPATVQQRPAARQPQSRRRSPRRTRCRRRLGPNPTPDHRHAHQPDRCAAGSVACLL